MKRIRKHIHLLVLSLLVSLSSCEDFALGEKFLQKAPGGDITADTIFLLQNMQNRYCGIVIIQCLMDFRLTIILQQLCGSVYLKI